MYFVTLIKNYCISFNRISSSALGLYLGITDEKVNQSGIKATFNLREYAFVKNAYVSDYLFDIDLLKPSLIG